MKNLIKNVIRSFKNNKISLIGLIFLLFFGLGTFCVMSNTTANINNQYTSIAKQGNLHDFTASELYEIGNAAYKCHNKGFTFNTTGGLLPTETFSDKTSDINKSYKDLYALPTHPTSGGDYYFIVPTQTMVEEEDNYIVTRTYDLELDANASTGLYAKFAKSGAPQVKFKINVLQTVAKDSVPRYVTAVNDLQGSPTDWTDTQMAALTYGETLLRDSGNALAYDYNYMLKKIDEQSTYIFNLMTSGNTPLSNYIDTKYKDELQYKFFKSINVTATKDNIFYKIIDSNPTDTIDKIVLFKDPNGNYGNNLFDVEDWAPYNSQMHFVDKEGKTIPLGTKLGNYLTVPKTFEDLIVMEPVSYDTMDLWNEAERFVYSQMMQIRFKRMLSGDMSTPNEDLSNYLENIAAVHIKDVKNYNYAFFNRQSTIARNYEEYQAERISGYGENIIVSMNGNIVVNWSTPTPLTLTMVNWTSHFSVINPQHLQATKKHILDSKWFNDFEPFKEWYKANYGYYPGGVVSAATAASWFNSLTNRQFNFWFNPSTFKENQMQYDILQKDRSIKPIIVTKGSGTGAWNGLPDESIASCGGYKQIIWGCGLSPDFMYPVVDITRPTPNVKTECLTYVNTAGYKALKLAFINSTMEDFLVAKFMPSVTTTRQNQIIDDLNKFCSDNMLFPRDVKAVYRANDTTNVLNSSGFRVSYIPNLVNVISLVSIILCSFLAILALVICLIIIKRYVENNRVNIGIMRANGVSKIKIALSLLPFALLPAIIGGIAAYLTGLFLQIPMLRLFGNYWTLPTPILSFDWISMVGCIFIPFILFGIITILAALWVLRTKSVELMKAGSEFKTNGFSRVVKKPFKYFGVLTRFRVALAFNSLSRLVVLALMSCLTMTSLVFAFTSFGKLNKSQVINSSQFDYSFNLQLTTPTSSGGNYNVEDWSKKRDDGTLRGLGYTNTDEYIYNVSWDTVEGSPYENLTKWYSHNTLTFLDLWGEYRDAIGQNGNLMLPTAADALGQAQDLQYLMNKTCSKLTLDYVVGLGSLSSNPWEIAIALMPANSRNIASDAYNTIVSKVGQKIKDKDAKWVDYEEFFAHNEKGELIEPFEMDVSTKTWLSHLSAKYTQFLVKIYTDPELLKDEYRISYGVIPTNWSYDSTTKKDEQYTYVNGTMSEISSKQRPSFQPSHEITIEGIKQDSQFIKLTDGNGNNLNNLLYEVKTDGDVKPIIINAFAAHKYNLGINGTFTLTATNTVDRYERKNDPTKFANDTSNIMKFKVVGISEGTNGEAFYCRQVDANNVLGLPNGTTWNKTHKYMLWQDSGLGSVRVIDLSSIGASDNKHYAVYEVDRTTGAISKEANEVEVFNKTPEGFNGIYTADKSGKPLTAGLSLYSNTGLYPGASVFDSDAMRKLLANDNNLSLANFISGIKDPETFTKCGKWLAGGYTDKDAYISDAVQPFIAKLKNLYGDTTMVTCICGANDVAASDLIYKNLISTFNLAQTSIMSVVIPITIIVVGIISNLIINDSKKMAAMLKALGYSDKKNAASILALFIPTIVLGLALAIPASIGICTGYQALVFGGANILIDVSRKWWYYLASVGGIGIVLVATYVVGWVSLKKDRLVDAIKR